MNTRDCMDPVKLWGGSVKLEELNYHMFSQGLDNFFFNLKKTLYQENTLLNSEMWLVCPLPDTPQFWLVTSRSCVFQKVSSEILQIHCQRVHENGTWEAQAPVSEVVAAETQLVSGCWGVWRGSRKRWWVPGASGVFLKHLFVLNR